VLDDLAVVEAKDIDASGFLTTPVQITYVYKGQIAVYGDALHLACNAPGLFDTPMMPSSPFGNSGLCWI
jgi:hypothetical protein